MTSDLDLEALTFPALLRGAQGAYASTVREWLLEAGFDDLPRSGPFVLSAVALTGAPLSEVTGWLRVSKQSAGQLVDTLVARGYLERFVDPEDRRRLRISLSERGSAAAQVIRAAVDDVDAQLAARVGPEAIAATRATLAALLTEAGNGA